MKLYYTNSVSPLGAQQDPDQSLGGFISITPIPNDYKNNLFGDISQMAKEDKNGKLLRLIALKNETGDVAEDVQIYYNYPDGAEAKFEVAIVAPAMDSCDNLVFEKLSQPGSNPLYATFSEANGEGNAVIIDSIPAGSYVGIWIRRTLLDTTTTPITTDQLIAAKDANIPSPTLESVELVIKYNESLGSESISM